MRLGWPLVTADKDAMPRYRFPIRSMVLQVSAMAVCLFGSGPAHAEPFKHGDLFIGRTIKPSAKDRTFSAGAHFQVAPVKAIIQSVVKKNVDAFTATNPEAKQMVDYIQYVDTAKVREFADSGKIEEFKKMLKEEMTAQGQTLTPEQTKAIDAIDAKKLKAMADVIEIYNAPEPTTTFSLEPFVTLNLKPVQFTAQIAVAGFHTEKATSVELGNLGFDVKTGSTFGKSGAAFGWSVGASTFLPTGTADADVISLSNVLASPRYLHDYLTVSGYGIVGAELAVFDLTLRGEYVNMLPSSSKNDDKLKHNDVKGMSYVNLGLGILADLGVVGIVAELDGLLALNDHAKAMDNVWLATAGVRSYLGPVQLGLGVQLPLVSPDRGATMSVGGADLGDPADFNVLLDFQVKF